MEERSPTGGITGYLVADFEQFLAAGNARTAALESAIEAEQARRDLAERTEVAAMARRQELAEAWATALRDADQIRASADAEAAAIIERAEQTARAIRARAILDRRANGHSMTTRSDDR